MALTWALVALAWAFIALSLWLGARARAPADDDEPPSPPGDPL
jgi:hypothetical protein